MGTSAVPGVRPLDEFDVRVELQRIADEVRRVAGARSVQISTLFDDERLEIVTVSGATTPGVHTVGRTWERSELDKALTDAASRGRLLVTRQRSQAYAELDDSEHPDDVRGTVIAPMQTAQGALLGVVSLDAPVSEAALDENDCRMLEALADQARMVLHHSRERDRLSERLRLAQAAQRIVHAAATQPDVPTLLDALAEAVAVMLRGRAAWVSTDAAPGCRAESSSSPHELALRLGPDVAEVLAPAVERCRRSGQVLSRIEDDSVAAVADRADHARALLTLVGHGPSSHGAVVVFRDLADPIWTDDERAALLDLGTRLSGVVRGVQARVRDGRLVDELRELDRYKRDLMASITHDLKTPLTSIALNTDLLEADESRAGNGSQVAAIRRSTDRLGRLVDDLLALARAEEDPVAAAVDADLVALVHDACRHAEEEARHREVSLVLDVPDVVRVPVDADALGRVLLQVVSNAVKFSEPGGQVRVSLERVGDGALFRVEDDGIGIPEADRSTVFDMFSRSSDPAAQAVPGSGMGLAIAQRIVSRLGGSIEVDSEHGRGSAFVVRVPGVTAGRSAG